MGGPADFQEQILEQLKSITYLVPGLDRKKNVARISTSLSNRTPRSLLLNGINCKIDVVDLNDAKESLVQQVKEEGVLWKDYAND